MRGRRLRIDIARCSGFCFGVKRAVGMAEKTLDKSGGRRTYSLGAIIHNKDVVGMLGNKGLKVVTGLGRRGRGDTVIICSHGVHPDTASAARKKRLRVVDATCPYVNKAQEFAGLLSGDGYDLIIAGDKKHPEVRALSGFARDKATVISSAAEASRLPSGNRRVGVIAQTTQSRSAFASIVAALVRKGFPELRVFDTICRDAVMRQEQVPEIAKRNDIILVVGGRSSANTGRLYQLCLGEGRPVYHIENARQIREGWLKGKHRIGIMSGASTPDWIIEQVVKKIKTKSIKKGRLQD